MLQTGKIKLRDIKELQEEDVKLANIMLTPLKKHKNPQSSSTRKKPKEEVCVNNTVIDGAVVASGRTKTPRKRLKRALLESSSNQKRIDSFFVACPKTFEIKFPIEQPATSNGKSKNQSTKTKGVCNIRKNKKATKTARRSKAKRKRLLSDSTEPSTENMSSVSNSVKVTKKMGTVECIVVDSDSDEENNIETEILSNSEQQVVIVQDRPTPDASTSDHSHISMIKSSPITASSLSFGQRMSKTSCASTTATTATNTFSRRKPKICPPYKIIENTTFAVDAFQFGYIENVTHYFLTHFHADHYIGLTRSFAMPLYMSPITARLVRQFIPVQEEYIHELELNKPCIINDIEVTALEANHCPGAILIVFKFLDSDNCVLHTGDFRACHEMESEPIFWNNHINTIYLDTTYISDKYEFCTQYESIMKAKDLIEKFIIKHDGKRILYICGSYVIGKEKFWSSLAETFQMKVWAEGNRYKALKAMDDERYNHLLVTDPNEADMHVIPMVKLSYLELIEHFKLYEQKFDIIFAIRPSGHEKDSKPRYGNKINVVGIEYSEHSSYAEMQRFVKFLKPDQVISTVPNGRDCMKTAIVPKSWYKYDKLKSSSNYQPSIDSFLGKKTQANATVRLPNINKGGVECFVSPLKSTVSKKLNNNNNIQKSKPLSIDVSKSTENNLMAKEVVEKNNKISPSQNSMINEKINQNLVRSKKRIRLISSCNSSEDFEKSDLIIKTKIMQRKKDTLKEKAKTNKKELTPKNNNMKLNPINSEEYFKTIEEKAKKIKKENGKAGNSNSQPYSSSDEMQSKMPLLANGSLKEDDLEICTSQKRRTRSQSALTQTAKASSGSQTQPLDNGKKLHSKSNINSNSTRSLRNRNYNKVDLTSDDECDTSDKSIIQQNLEIPISQKRITRLKSTSTKTTNVSSSSQHKVEEEFESKLLKITQQQNDKIDNNNNSNINNIKSKTTTNFKTYKENPIFASSTNTDSTIDPNSADEMQKNSLQAKIIKPNSTASSDNFLNHFYYPTNSVGSKRRSENPCLTTIKKTKNTIIDTKTILSTILEQSQDRYNCSQLAGLVVETLNKQNPDYSKDHIPTELLSDADDDWM